MSKPRRKPGGPAKRRRCLVENLEHRVVLDAGIGVEVADSAVAPPVLEKFESAEEMQQYLIAYSVDRWKDLFGTETHRWPHYYFPEPYLLEADGVIPRLAQTDALPLATAGFDGTNVQVAGIDESDIVKTDGEYLYISNDSRLTIVDARDPANLSITAEIQLENYSNDLFVTGDRLAVISHDHGFVPYIGLDIAVDAAFAPPFHFQPTTSITVYDVSDPSTPTVVSDTTLDGTLTTARRTDELVYLVTSNSLRLPTPEVHCPEADSEATENAAVSTDWLTILPHPWPDDGIKCVYETEAEYVARIEDSVLEDTLASFEVTDANGEVTSSGLLADPTNVYKPFASDPFAITSVAVMDLSSDVGGFIDSTNVVTSHNSTVYASASNIYVASTSYDGEGVSTKLQQFSIDSDGTSVDLRAVGTVPGSLLNQFSLDEHDGHLRVVTSTGWGNDRINSLHVLKQSETSLDVVGSIDEIATGESVFAVRFMGDEAFVVTFRVIDPLFTIDLTDPTNPTIEGELEIPGFSNYLHPITEDLLVGLGRDDGGWNGNPQLSLFDVSDFTSPERIDQFVFEGMSWSEAFYNHHAINYFADSQIAVVPFNASYTRHCSFDALSVLGDCERPQNSFWVIQVDTSGESPSIDSLGAVEVEGVPSRSVRIDDTLFLISTEQVVATELQTPENTLGEIFVGRVVLNDFFKVDALDGETELDVLANDRVDEQATIIAVDDSGSTGEVAISADGRSILYTAPNDGKTRRDYFSYTVEVNGIQKSGDVSVRVSQESSRQRMVRLAKDHLIERFGLEDQQDAIRLASADYVEWEDSCLGLADDGEACAQVITPGYRIVFEYSFAEIIYHTDLGEQVLPANEPDITTDALVELRAEVLDASGNPTDSLVVGEEGTLQIVAVDPREDAQGVFAAYLDVLYDSSIVTDPVAIINGSAFPNGRSGDASGSGLIDELGAFDGSSNHDKEKHLASIQFTASNSGELRFTLDPADVLPEHDILLLGLNSAIPQNLVTYGEVVVDVVDTMHNETMPTDTNMDGVMTAIDALLIVNHLNLYGAGPVAGEAAAAIRSAASDVNSRPFAPDVNGDGFITALDALIIINGIDGVALAEGEGEGALELTTKTATTQPITSSFATSIARTRRTSDKLIDAVATDSEDVIQAIDVIASSISQRNESAVSKSLNEDDLFADLAETTADDWWMN